MRLSFIILLFVFVSCRKQDISPAPVGEPVEYNGPTASLKEVLEKSPYTFFNAAWKHAGMDAILDATGSKAFTLLAPADKAFQDAGWTMEKINAATPETLVSLLSYYVSSGNILPESLSGLNSNIVLTSLKKSTDLPNYSAAYPYTYLLFAGVHHDSLMINGQAVSKWGSALQSITATIYPLDKLLSPPQTDMLTYLQSDERFNFYLEACRINDSLYLDAFPYDNGLLNLPLLSAMPLTGGQMTLFAPTNNAFRKSGFNSVEDIRAYSVRALPIGNPDLDADNYFVVPTSAMDSLLLPNRFNFAGISGPTTGQRDLNMVYFENELLDNGKGVSGLLIKEGSLYNYKTQVIPLSFSNNNGQLLVKKLGSDQPGLPLAEKNIRVLNGVIHVVDEGLFMP